MTKPLANYFVSTVWILSIFLIAELRLNMLVQIYPDKTSFKRIHQRTMLASGKEKHESKQNDIYYLIHRTPPFLYLTIKGSTNDTCALVGPK